MRYMCELEEKVTQPTLSVRTRTPVQNLPEVLGPAWGAIMRFLGELGEQPAGPPYVAYYNMDMHKGPYPEVGQAYEALGQWTHDNGREATGIAYETYLNDPGNTPPGELLTQVAWLLKSG